MLNIPLGHEVYVLSDKQIAIDKADHSTSLLDALSTTHNKILFLAFTLGIGGTLLVALLLKKTLYFQKIGNRINRATYFAPDVIRVALGASLIFSSINDSLFGPELPLHDFIGGSSFLKPALMAMGILLVAGLFTRLIGVLTALLWIGAFATKGWYLLTYANYLGEAIAATLIPMQNLSLNRLIKINFSPFKKLDREEWAMPIARILFGFSLLYAAINVKFLHPAISLDVVNRYNLQHVFHMDSMFVVFGAALTEVLVACLYLLGLLQRVTTIIFITFITLSLFYFKESVWPHYLLLGLGLGIFLHKPDKLALDSKLFNRNTKIK